MRGVFGQRDGRKRRTRGARDLTTAELEVTPEFADYRRLSGDSEFDFTDRSGYMVVTGSRIASTAIEPGELTAPASYFAQFALVAEQVLL